MHQSPSEILQDYLQLYHITPQQFARLSGMPIGEVRGLLEGSLAFTELRANHLAAVFNTPTNIWLSGRAKKSKPTTSLV